MPRFAANLSLLYTELPFLDRFEAAARDGFEAVEYLFPYAFDLAELLARLKANGLQQVLFNAPPGGTDAAGIDAAWAALTPAERVVLFRAMDFVEYLRKTRSEELKANNLWLALKRTCGATHVRVRTPQGVKNLWCVPVPEVEGSVLPDFGPEF